MKKISRILAIVLALVMVLSGSVFAAWVSFQNDGTNNGVITTNAPTSGNIAVTTVQLPQGGFFSGVDVPPVIDEDGNAYVLVSAATTTRLVKVNLANATISSNCYWAGDGASNRGVELRDTSAFQLSTPVISGSNIYVAATEYIQKTVDSDFNSLLTLNPLWTVNPTSGLHHPVFSSYGINSVKVTDSDGTMNLDFTLTQTFNAANHDNLRIEGAVLGNSLGTGTFQVFLNNSSTPLISLDLTQNIGLAFNEAFPNTTLQDGANTVTIRIICSGNGKNPFVQLQEFKLFAERSSIECVDCATGAKTPVLVDIPGQINTPLTIANNNKH